MNKDTIERNFSRYARHYDEYATIQNRSALRLIAKAKSDKFRRILDIGCGTGNYTRLLKNKFPQAEIKALDISKEMIAFAHNKLGDRKIEFIAADAETIDFHEKFDLITSNVSLQWFSDLEKTLVKYKGLLKRNGIILFSIFGSLTLHELSLSLKELFKQNVLISSHNFIDKDGLTVILKKFFTKISIEEEIVEEGHNSVWELLNKIRHTGARGNGISIKNILRSQIIELEKIYKRKFDDLKATYQIFYCKAAG